MKIPAETAMPRMARVVCPNLPHHITQRGVRRFNVFLDEADHRRYGELLGHYAQQHGLGIAAYCLMTNHVHIVGIPERKDSIAKTFGECHGTYATEFNKKYGKAGHVWQARPYSCVLDEDHAWAAVRYVERNPLRARMVTRAEDYVWSSARAHCGLEGNRLLTAGWPDCSLVTNWSAWLEETPDVSREHRIRERTYTGRPCGSEDFVRQVEAIVGRRLAPGKPGPKPKRKSESERMLWLEDEIRR
jgi:putative transposase